MHKYKIIARVGEGTFSEVLKAVDVSTNELVAIKRMRSHISSVQEVNGLREIQALRKLRHENIVQLKEVLYDRKLGRLALVFELMDLNLYELIRNRRHYLSESRIKALMYNLFKALDYTHRNAIFHRDIKPENILVSNTSVKLADYGSCRGIYTEPPYTEYISTRWYRPPEALITNGHYNFKMDIWGVGCVFFEIATLYPLFPGRNEVDQLDKIHSVLGTPNQQTLNQFRGKAHISLDFPKKSGTGIKKLVPHLSRAAIDLMEKLLRYNPEDRLSARQALKHEWFSELRAQGSPQPVQSVKEQTKPRSSGPVHNGMTSTTSSLPQINSFATTTKSEKVSLSPSPTKSKPKPKVRVTHKAKPANFYNSNKFRLPNIGNSQKKPKKSTKAIGHKTTSKTKTKQSNTMSLKSHQQYHQRKPKIKPKQHKSSTKPKLRNRNSFPSVQVTRALRNER
ncbi:hypothetical protein PCE1_002140 [Barthelona sp. PCE]